MKISNKQEFQQISINHLSNIDFKDYLQMYSETISFLVIKIIIIIKI